ncbi:hypothetical protein ACWEVD_07505 [Nocardia thailandica]
MDPVSLAVGAGLLALGWVAGRFVPSRGGARGRGSELARCGCGHDLALHDRESGRCNAETSRRGMHGMREWVGCRCRRYTGPIPLEEVFTPPILPPSQD